MRMYRCSPCASIVCAVTAASVVLDAICPSQLMSAASQVADAKACCPGTPHGGGRQRGDGPSRGKPVRFAVPTSSRGAAARHECRPSRESRSQHSAAAEPLGPSRRRGTARRRRHSTSRCDTLSRCADRPQRPLKHTMLCQANLHPSALAHTAECCEDAVLEAFPVDLGICMARCRACIRCSGV